MLQIISAISAGVVWFTLNVVVLGLLSNCATTFFAIATSVFVPKTINSFVIGFVVTISVSESPGLCIAKIFLFKKSARAAALIYFTGIKVISCFAKLNPLVPAFATIIVLSSTT